MPVIVKNVTDGWPALEHWTKKELLRRYPDVMVGMGRSLDLGQTGPDAAGDALTKTTIKVRIVKAAVSIDITRLYTSWWPSSKE